MSDLPVLEWEPGKGKHYADVAELGVVVLFAWHNGWKVQWMHDRVVGPAESIEDAKAKARQCAKTLLRQALEQLDRAIDPVTGLVTQLVAQVAADEDSHA